MKIYDYGILCRDADNETKKTKCQVKGEIPSWLNCSAMYNGPGKLSLSPKAVFKHTFDGLALLQRFQFKDGEAYYDSKFLESYVYKECIKAKSITRCGFATPGPDRSLFSRLTSTADSDKMYSDNANLAIIKIGKRYLVLAEVPVVFEVDPVTLEVIDRVNLNKEFGIVIQSVHFCEHKGKYYTIAQTFGLMGSKYVVIEIPPCGSVRKLKIVTSIAPRFRFHPSHVHSMVISENYALFMEHSFTLSMGDLVKDIFTNTPFIHSTNWTNDKVHLRILDVNTWKPIPQNFVTDSLFAMHFSNMYEEGGNLIFETPCYKDSGLVQNFHISHLQKPKDEFTKEEDDRFLCKISRFVVPLDMKLGGNEENLLGTKCSATSQGKEIHLESDALSDLSLEHPVINPKYKGKKHRYIYGSSFPETDKNYGNTIKIDIETREVKIYSNDKDHMNSVLFVPRPDGIDEDDGVIIANSPVSGSPTVAKAVIFDAKTMDNIAEVLVDTGNVVPLPMHSSYFSNDD